MSNGNSLIDVLAGLAAAALVPAHPELVTAAPVDPSHLDAVGHSILAVAGVAALLLLLVAGRPSRPAGGAQSAAVTLQR